MTDTSKASFDVVPGPSGGWSVQRSGDPEAISWHETREQAEEAARLQGAEGQEVDKRGDVFTSDAGEAAAPKRTFMLVAAFAVAVISLLEIVALIAS